MYTKEKTRNEIDDKYKWDLTTIYKSDDEWQKDFDKAKEDMLKISDYKDNFLSSSDKLYKFLKYDKKIDRLISKLYYYAHLNFDVDTGNDKYKEMFNKTRDLLNKYNELTSFVVPYILKSDYSVFEKYYEENPVLLEYKFQIDNIYRFKKHTLDEEKEKMLSSFSNLLSNPEDTFATLTDTDLKFGTIKDENNNECEFNESNYSLYIKSKDRRVRKDAFNLLLEKYSEFKNTIASTFSGNVESNIVVSKIKNYDSAINSALFSDNIDTSVYDNLINVVNSNMNVIYKYYDLKKKVLKLDELHLYDVYVELIGKSNRKLTKELLIFF